MTFRFLLGVLRALTWSPAAASPTERGPQNRLRMIVGAPEEK